MLEAPPHVEDPAERHRIRFVSIFYVLVAGTILVYTPLRLVIDPTFWNDLPFVGGIAAVYVMGFYLARRNHVAIGSAIIVASFSIGMLGLAFLQPGNRHILFLLPIPVLVSATILSRSSTILIFTAELVGISLVSFLSPSITAAYAIRPAGALIFTTSLALAMETHIRSVQRDQRGQLLEVRDATVFALAHQAELRDQTTGTHLERTAKYVTLLAARAKELPVFADYLTQEYTQDLSLASVLHDVGKVGIPDSILLKGGKLSEDEFSTMTQHCLFGVQVLEIARSRLQSNTFYDLAISIARSHHERWDGTGYPDGLAGDAIPISARIMALCDVYDALRSRRPYKDPFSHEQAVAIINEGAGSHFDPRLAEIFQQHHSEFAAISKAHAPQEYQ